MSLSSWFCLNCLYNYWEQGKRIVWTHPNSEAEYFAFNRKNVLNPHSCITSGSTTIRIIDNFIYLGLLQIRLVTCVCHCVIFQWSGMGRTLSFWQICIRAHAKWTKTFFWFTVCSIQKWAVTGETVGSLYNFGGVFSWTHS